MGPIPMSRKPERSAARGEPEKAPGSIAPAPPEVDRDPGLPFLRKDGMVAALLLGVTLIAYGPVWRAGFIWDDDGHVTRAGLRSLRGLWRIWFEPGATQQYYPLLHSAFWLEHRLWGDSALGYHLANVILHSAAAWLLYRLLRRLSLSGALLAALVFALHPVCVESVAWVSEQKNTLSAVFCLAAALAYLRFDRERRPSSYAVGALLFGLAMAAKSVTATLPAALLVILWWKRGRLTWRGDVAPLGPWLLAGAAAGLVTAWVERTYIGASGAAFGLSPVDRFLVAGRALWFYLGKLLWPADLAFIYPRWAVDSGAPAQYLFPAAAALVLAALFALRGRSRGPLAAALLFAGTLFPALGFINVFPFVYSFVADHFQYLASAVAIAALCAALTSAASHLARPMRLAARAAAACTVVGLGWLTWRQCGSYSDPETLWRATIARNPGCWMAYENLGGVFMKEGRVDQAVVQFRGALQINPNDTGALNELGVAMLQQGRVDPALEQFRRAAAIAPDDVETHINLGVALLGKGNADEAAAHFERALAAQPNNAKARKNLGAAFAQKGQWDDAAVQFGRAAEIEPDSAETLDSLGSALVRAGKPEKAIAQFRRALELADGSPQAHFDLANALAGDGKQDEAILHFRRALEINPRFAEAHNNLANELLRKGAADEAVAQFQKAVEVDPTYAEAHFNLANILLRLGRTDQAIAHFQRAVEIRPEFAIAHYNLAGAFLQAGRLDEAEAQLRATLDIEPGNAQVHNDLGAVLVGRGRAEEAVVHYRRALEIKPDFPGALINLGNLSLQRGRAAEAVGDYTRALGMDPGNARVRNNLGIALVRLGRDDEAAAEFRKALESDPNYEDARKNLSIVARRTGGAGAR